jgi:nitrogen fixation NifU-like protein
VFSDALLDHFERPRNAGPMQEADAEAEDENPVCGDRLHLWLRVREGAITEASWLAEGCAPALAAASVTSELLHGMTLEQARELSRERVAEALGGLPPRKAHAAMLAVSAVHKAIDAYLAQKHEG